MRRQFTSVIRTFALNASELRGLSIKSDVVSPVKATSGDNIMSEHQKSSVSQSVFLSDECTASLAYF